MKTLPHCTKSGPPCSDLLEDARAVMADRDRWPDHVCDNVARESTRRWAMDRAASFYGSNVPEAVQRWAESWPLPVGRLALAPLRRTGFTFELAPLFPGLAPLPPGLAPLPHFGKAAVIVSFGSPTATVEAFGIVDDHPLVKIETDGKRDMLPGTPQFVVAGWLDKAFPLVGNDANPFAHEDHEAAAFVDQFIKWWTRLSGKNLASGRPRGSTDRTLEDYVRMLHEFEAKHGRKPSSRAVFINDFDPPIPESTFKNNLDSFGLLWSQFREKYTSTNK